jgi:hypothetical protein
VTTPVRELGEAVEQRGVEVVVPVQAEDLVPRLAGEGERVPLVDPQAQVVEPNEPKGSAT